jgi:hypothetical protein
MVTVVSADPVDGVPLAAALLPGVVLPAEPQAATAALKDMTHRIPAMDRVFSFISWSLYSVGFD